jgi:hypothetical protein
VLSALVRDDFLRFFAEFIEPEVLLVISSHLHAVDQLCHELSHCLGLADCDSDGVLVEQFDVESHHSLLFEQFAVDLVVGTPVSLHELALEQEDVVVGRFVGVGGQA